jgi:hypothetical protein
MTEFNYYAMQWYGRTSAEQREHCLRWYVEPAARLIFRAVPEAQSVVLAISQYWCDEANDATHLSLYASPERAPQWPKLLDTALFDGETYERNAVSENIHTVTGGGFGDSNYGNIVAFGSQCRSDCHQEMSTKEAYRPWAVVRRTAEDDCETKVVGKTLQRGFEDNFNVGFSRIGEGEAEDFYEGPGPRLQDLSRETLRAYMQRGEAARRIRALEDELRKLVTDMTMADSAAALLRMYEELSEAIAEANAALEASEMTR